MDQDRRASVRVTRSLPPSDIKIPKGEEFSASFYAVVKDISLIGVRLEVPQKVTLSEKILLTLTLPTNATPKFKTFKIEVSVTRVAESQNPGKFEAAGTFLKISEDAKNAIRGFYLS